MQKKCEVDVGYDSEKEMEHFAAILRPEIRRLQGFDPGDLSSIIQEMGNNWYIRPMSIPRKYHFNVFLTSDNTKFYLGLYTQDALSRKSARRSILNTIKEKIEKSLPNLQTPEDLELHLVIKSADKTWYVEKSDMQNSTGTRKPYDTFEEAWEDAKQSAQKDIFTYCQNHPGKSVSIDTSKDEQKKEGHIGLRSPVATVYYKISGLYEE